MNKVSLIIPVFDEEEGIETLAHRVTTVLGELDYEFEIVLVDDGSIDRTLESLQVWQKKDDRVVIVKLSRNWGHQRAYNAGLDVARGDAVIFMDGDLEDPPEVIPELLLGWEEGFDVVYTVKAERHQNWVRKNLTRMYYWSLKSAARYGVEAQAGMFSLVNKKVADVLRNMPESNKSYPNLRSMAGFKQKSITYSRDKRAFGKPKQTLGRLVLDGMNALFSNSYFPIRAIMLAGLLFSIVFIFVGIIVAFVRLTGLEFWIFRSIPGTQMILITILAFGSLQIMFLGILGEYIARIYEESKGRPYYIIDEVVRSKSADQDENS
jgi:dolichol-phosphate mannosyltransferase